MSEKRGAKVFISSARNITGGLIYIPQTFCSTNFLPVFLRRNKLTIRWIFNKNQEKSPSTFLIRILDTSDMFYQHIFTDKLRLRLSIENVNIKMASKARMIEEGKRRERESDSEREYFDYFLIRRSTRGIHYWVFQFIRVQLTLSAFYFLRHDKRSTRIVGEQSLSSIAILRPLKTTLFFQFLKVRQALSCDRFYLKNTYFFLLPTGISLLPEQDIILEQECCISQ